MALGPRITMILVVRDDAVNVQVEGDAPPCFGLLRFDALLVVMGVGGPEDVRKISLRLCGAPHSRRLDRKSTRLNSSHVAISYAVFCLKKKKKKHSNSTHYTS